jgi:hypothetical protein
LQCSKILNGRKVMEFDEGFQISDFEFLISVFKTDGGFKFCSF